jgi:triosephosphate isomerase
LAHLSIAYEPVWAIGNAAHHATPQQAQDAHAAIRRQFGQIFGETESHRLIVQYGGSVVADNTAAFLSRPGIDGALVGGASLKADEFLAIVRAAFAETRAEMQTA